MIMAPPTKAQRKRSAAVVEAFNKRFSTIYGDERWHQSLCPALAAPTRQAALLNPSTTTSTSTTALKIGEQIPFLSIPCLQCNYDGSSSNNNSAFPQPTDGSYYLLDAASVVAVQVLDVQPGQRVLDLCAAPGGKSIAVAQTAASVTVDSNEVDRARFKHLEANLKYHLPADRYRVMNLDGTQATPTPIGEGAGAAAGYDRVLVDAPCSSERHIIHAHAKKASAGQIADEMVNWKAVSSTLAKTQLALLKTALKAVKIGGKVVYATCSLSPDENDGIIGKYLQQQQQQQQKWAVEVVQELKEDDPIDAISEKTRYGRIILPDHSSGHHWGPIFFAIINKVER